MICKAFAVCDAGYTDPAIVALTSFMKYNGRSVQLRVYVEAGTNYQRLRRALSDYPVGFLEVEFPKLPEHAGVHNAWSSAFFQREALPAFAQRIKSLEELRESADLIINLDLDTLTVGSLAPLLERCDTQHIYGVSERENRTRWMRAINAEDIAAMPAYFNTGMAIYGREALEDDLLEKYRGFLREYGPRLYCPEQDFINFTHADKIRSIPAGYNLMYTDRDYATSAPVVLHFLGTYKPWSAAPAPAPKIGHYFQRYLREAERLGGLLSEDFLKRCHRNASLV